MISYIWPKDDQDIKKRVVTAMGLLVSAKMINTSVPFIFRSLLVTLVIYANHSYNSALQLTA